MRLFSNCPTPDSKDTAFTAPAQSPSPLPSLNSADFLAEHFPIPENNHRRDRHNPILDCNIRPHRHSAFRSSLFLITRPASCPSSMAPSFIARTAPVCIKINQYRNLRFQYLLLKIPRCKLHFHHSFPPFVLIHTGSQQKCPVSFTTASFYRLPVLLPPLSIDFFPF